MITSILQLIKMGFAFVPYFEMEYNPDAQLGSALNRMVEKGVNTLDSMSLQGGIYDSGCDY